MNYYLDAWKKYAVFRGRARRKEYWIFQLFNFIIILFLILALAFMYSVKIPILPELFSFLMIIFILAIILPSLSISVRRLHDFGLSGWWVLIGLIPYIGGLVLFVLHCIDSQYGENKYGSNPKGINVVFVPNTNSDASNPPGITMTSTQNPASVSTGLNYYLNPWKKFAVFQGRSRRKEFWMFMLFNVIISYALTFIRFFTTPTLSQISFLVTLIYGFAVLLPFLGLSIRRLHDIGKSGWWMLPLYLFQVFFLVLYYFIAPGIFSMRQNLADFQQNAIVMQQSITALQQSGWLGWLVLTYMIGGIYSIVMFVFFCLDSQPGENKYGPNPKAISTASTPNQPI